MIDLLNCFKDEFSYAVSPAVTCRMLKHRISAATNNIKAKQMEIVDNTWLIVLIHL